MHVVVVVVDVVCKEDRARLAVAAGKFLIKLFFLSV